ncbi:hypothetical protein BBBOND_0311120 [Babesia bigemina]|uniref:Uncharacterized protein n=1 Tax=Babesia bigemina TaxID=5866 RepID=A0A061DD96_BABBI|nr:hypothetical protein BBBOND_0311120 [Babesia bigemina]CDR97209.1 hypothetical protein BBBOND_0311120 [Babesia bigemina]|eukprot:XP_012769395.1 hypothetical protein BBBOND_0311120 [Babesia bigemina]
MIKKAQEDAAERKRRNDEKIKRQKETELGKREDEERKIEDERQLQREAMLPGIDVVFKARESSDKSLNAYLDALQNQLKSVPPTVGLQVTVPSRYDANSDDNPDVFEFGKSVTLNIVKPDLIDVDESVEADLDKTLVYNSDVKGDVLDHVNDIMIVDVSGEDVPEEPDPVLDKPSHAKTQRIVAQHNVDSLICGQATSDAKGIPDFAVPQGSSAIGVPIGYSIKPPKLPKIPPPPPPTMELTGNLIPDHALKYSWLPPPRIHIETAPRNLPIINVDIEKPYTSEHIMQTELRRTTYLPHEMVDPEPLPAYNVNLDIAPKLKVYNNSSYMPTAELKPQPLNNPDFSIHIPKPRLQDTSYDLKIDEPPPLQALQPLDPIDPYTTSINLNLDAPEPIPELPNKSAADYTHNTSTLQMCVSSWATPTPTPSSTDIPDTELFPSQVPRTVREMLTWLAGLMNEKHHYTLEKCINKAFSGLYSDPSQLALSINGSYVRPTDVFDILQLTAMFAGSVLSAIAPNWKANVSSRTMTTKSTTQSDEPDCCALLCQLRDYVYASHYQLEFLKAQCNRDESHGGWQDCNYGSDTNAI